MRRKGPGPSIQGLEGIGRDLNLSINVKESQWGNWNYILYLLSHF